MVVPVMGQLSRLHISPKKWNIQCFIVDTPSQPPIRKYLYGSYIYRSEWIEKEDIQNITRLLVKKTYNGEYALSNAFRRAFGDDSNVPSFKETYWQELEIPFTDFLMTLEQSEGVVAERKWNEILSKHVDELYKRLTGSLYNNSSLLVNVVEGEKKIKGFLNSLRDKEAVKNEQE